MQFASKIQVVNNSNTYDILEFFLRFQWLSCFKWRLERCLGILELCDFGSLRDGNVVQADQVEAEES